MNQDFHGGVGQVAGGDIKNYGVNVSLVERTETRVLVSAQRQELHELRAKCEELGDDPRDVWRAVHAQLGVTTISEITTERFIEARDAIQARLESLQEEADKRRLVGKVLRAVAEKDAKVELNNFCELNFGRTQLKGLQKVQLQKALEFVQSFTPGLRERPTPCGTASLTLKGLLTLHTEIAVGIFVFGVFVGGILF